MRWLVERSPGNFEDVGAKYCYINHGCLVFHDTSALEPKYMIAAGQWITVVSEEE